MLVSSVLQYTKTEPDLLLVSVEGDIIPTHRYIIPTHSYIIPTHRYIIPTYRYIIPTHRYRYIIWEYFVVEFYRVWPKYV